MSQRATSFAHLLTSFSAAAHQARPHARLDPLDSARSVSVYRYNRQPRCRASHQHWRENGAILQHGQLTAGKANQSQEQQPSARASVAELHSDQRAKAHVAHPPRVGVERSLASSWIGGWQLGYLARSSRMVVAVMG